MVYNCQHKVLLLFLLVVIQSVLSQYQLQQYVILSYDSIFKNQNHSMHLIIYLTKDALLENSTLNLPQTQHDAQKNTLWI